MYIHYSATCTTRIDRFYLSADLVAHKVNISTHPTPFTNHEAVTITMALPKLATARRRGRWMLDPTILTDKTILITITAAWSKWKTRQRFYPTEVMWWERMVKPQLQRILRRAECARYSEYRQMEHHLYKCLYDIIQRNMQPKDKLSTLQKYKAKIIRLHSTHAPRALLDLDEKDFLEGEEPSIHHLLRVKQRRNRRNITQIRDATCTMLTTTGDITDHFLAHLRDKYQAIAGEAVAIDLMLQAIHPAGEETVPAILAQPVQEHEVHKALRMGAKRKAPGVEGLMAEFYATMWDAIGKDITGILNRRFQDNLITPQLTQGIIVCLPKVPNPMYD
jgi:hypothetical protein